MKTNVELFTDHLKEIIKRHPEVWKFLDEESPHKGIYMSSKWRDGVLRTTIILYNSEYPERPPIVKATPRPKDVCFDSEGFLHWAEKSRTLVWNRYKNHLNPLIYLVDELYDKYGADLLFDLSI